MKNYQKIIPVLANGGNTGLIKWNKFLGVPNGGTPYLVE